MTFLLTSDGGRLTPPVLSSRYRPHIVIQSPDIRHATVDDGGICREQYLGVCFVCAPDDYRLGQSVEVTLDLMYHPRVDYGAVQPGSTFTIREGGRVVGYGRVASRCDP